MLAGLLDIVRIDEWDPGNGSVTSWHASPASRAKAMAAPVSTVPASYMQAQHVRGFHDYADRGLEYSRLCSVSWDEPGQCDVRAMNYVINAHLRRHDTYRSWFERKDEGRLVRHTMQSANDVKFVPTKRGQMSAKDFQQVILDTPDLNEWDCFTFGVIQYEDHFTFYFIVDHVHADPMIMGMLYVEVHQSYNMIREGGAPPTLPEPAGYDDFCVRQHQLTSSLTAESPEVRRWVDFANADGTLPEFALPLGDPDAHCGGTIMVVELMNGEQTQKFESACLAAGSRFVGGVFAAAAVAQYRLTGVDSYFGMTPRDLRTKPDEYVTTGWYTGMVPVEVSVVEGSFAQTVRAAQKSFDGNSDLARIPFDRVRELVPRLHRARSQGYPMLAYLDAGLPPLSAVVASKAGDANARTFCDGLSPAHICMWVGRVGDETSLTVFYPDNAIARDSVLRYVEAMQDVYAGVAEGREVVTTTMRETA